MAASFRLCGVKNSSCAFIRKSLFSNACEASLSSSRVEFVASPDLWSVVDGAGRRRALRVRCTRGVRAVVEEKTAESKQRSEGNEKQFTSVMKFGGSSVASAERMREIADLIRSFPEERPVIVLSAMGKTTNKLLLVLHKHNHIYIYNFLLFRFLLPSVVLL